MNCSTLVLSGVGPSTSWILSTAEEDWTSEKGHVGEISDHFPGGNDSGFGVTVICRLSVPGWARQGSGRAASSRSPSSNGGASGDAAVRGPRARPEPLTPGRHAAPAPTAPSPRAPGRPLRFLAAGPAPLGPWGFACCRAMGTLHASKPPPRSAPRPGAQRPVPRSSPGISGHGPGAGEGGSAGRRHLLARPAAPGRAPGGGFTRAGAGAAWSRAGSAPGFPRCGGRAPGSEVGTDAARGPPSPAAPTG